MCYACARRSGSTTNRKLPGRHCCLSSCTCGQNVETSRQTRQPGCTAAQQTFPAGERPTTSDGQAGVRQTDRQCGSDQTNTYLHVCLGEHHHLRQDVGDVQVLHLVPAVVCLA
jgi:hypothetical protein